MAFSLSIDAIYTAIEEYDKLFTDYNTKMENCHNAVMGLSNDGWQGESGNEFYEKFLIWVQEAGLFFERLSYLGKTMITIGALAEILQVQYSSIPQTIGTDDGLSDVIYFEDKNISEFVKTAKSDWQEIQKSLVNLEETGSKMSYKTFNFSTSGDLASEIKSTVNLMDAFDKAFAEYATNVTAFEKETPGKLKYAISNDFDYNSGNSLIGWDDDLGFAIDLTKDALLPRLCKGFKIPEITQSGDNTIFSGFKKGSFSGKYVTKNLKAGKYADAAMAVKLNKAVKGLEVAGWVMIGVSAAFSGVEEYSRNPYLLSSKKAINTTGAVAYDLTVSAASLGGAKIGAAIGTAICPGIGTLIGGLVGGIAVGICGNAIKNSVQENERNRRYNELFGD
ncbi:MAG: hypothetical protein LBL82_05890 [Oscillospiraceae bacterium]|jgi:uncharacterized protein YukE|nr:hypothetical protein [Oscillospiraceae bacterium]